MSMIMHGEKMRTRLRIPDDKESLKLLNEVLEKPAKWYYERAERAIKASIRRQTLLSLMGAGS